MLKRIVASAKVFIGENFKIFCLNYNSANLSRTVLKLWVNKDILYLKATVPKRIVASANLLLLGTSANLFFRSFPIFGTVSIKEKQVPTNLFLKVPLASSFGTKELLTYVLPLNTRSTLRDVFEGNTCFAFAKDLIVSQATRRVLKLWVTNLLQMQIYWSTNKRNFQYKRIVDHLA